MDNYQNNSSYGWILFLIIVVIILWHQKGDLQNQNDAYKLCIQNYQDQNGAFKTAIDDASNYLGDGGIDNYQSAQDALNIDTSEVSCDIPGN